MPLTFATPDQKSIPLIAVEKTSFDTWLTGLSVGERAWVATSGFTAGAGSVLVFANANGDVSFAAFGMGDSQTRRRKRFLLGVARSKLPDGVYDIQGLDDQRDLEEAALGWLLAGYRFDRYKNRPGPKAMLVAPKGVDAARLEIIARAEALSRDLINTPASDMGPDELEAAAREMAGAYDASVSVKTGDALLEQNFPMIHAVGRAASRAPRLLEINWGQTGPTLALVGKGVCFDTGGLNIKPGASMGLMKKDMGGAAAVLGLAQMIMALTLPLKLRVLIPAVENSIGGDAFRPQDILTSRKGLSVEINNTDAEGRLVLADALAYADEDEPDLIVSMATLTGAARVALGPDLAPFFATANGDAQVLSEAAETVRDPVWRLPFWDPYETMIEPDVADLDNAPKGGMAGSITAALFLRRFVSETQRYIHFDIYGWQPVAAPARPKGGAAQGTRALLEALPKLLSL